MAKKKRTKDDRANTPPDPDDGHANGDVPDPIERSDRFAAKKWLTITIVLAVIWWIALSLLTLLSANPTTVNRMQVVNSDLVVIAQVKDVKSGTVDVTQQWIDPNPQTTLVVSGLSEFDVKNGDTIVLPLTGGPDGTFFLTRVQHTKPNPKGTTYIYPATDEVLEQVEEFSKIEPARQP